MVREPISPVLPPIKNCHFCSGQMDIFMYCLAVLYGVSSTNTRLQLEAE